MFSSYEIERVYGPDTLKIMTTAFDNAHGCLPAKYREDDRARRKLALLVIRHMERGERNPGSLADLAVLDFLRQSFCHTSLGERPARGLVAWPRANLGGPGLRQSPKHAIAGVNEIIRPVDDQEIRGLRAVLVRDRAAAGDQVREIFRIFSPPERLVLGSSLIAEQIRRLCCT